MKSERIIIRVDGNSDIGLGHIYRGIALANMLKDVFEIKFITKFDSQTSIINNAGFDFVIIPENIALLQEPNWFKDKFSVDTIIVLDGYDFNENYQEQIKSFNFKLVYIDDLAIGTQKADLVINHSPGIKESDYKTEDYTKLALGLDYALLRPSFFKETPKIELSKNSIFLCFGGADINDLTLKITKYLLEIKLFSEINIVIGEVYNNKEIFNLQKTSSEINLFRNLSEEPILKIMQKSSFAIAPASNVLFELLAVGIPVLSGYYVDNQKKVYKYLVDNNIVFGIGDFNKIRLDRFKKILLKMINSNTENKSIIDKRQKQRIIEKIKLL